MKRIRLFSFASLLVLAVGCNQEELSSENNVVISAVIEESSNTRSHATDEGSFTWSAGDKISVYTSSGNFRTFTLKGEGGTATADFTGTLLGGETITQCAAYPKNSNHSVSDNILTFNMPTEYGNFETEYVANTNAAMVALMENSTDFNFKHIGGVLRFKLDNVPVGAAQLVFTATDKDITGDFEVDLNADTPTISAREKTSANTVTIKFKPLESVQNDMTFFIPLPVGTYNGFTIVMKKQDGTQLVAYEHESSNTMKRKSLARFPKLTFADVSGSIEGDDQEASEHEYVDLGLSVLWATTNVGADSPEEYGDYFAWGETVAKTSNFNYDNYKFLQGGVFTKYTGSDYTVLQPEDDAATANWGVPWRMPTEEEIYELMDRDKCKWVETDGGWTVTSLIEGYTDKSIFLPAAGFYLDSELTGMGSEGTCWSSTLVIMSYDNQIDVGCASYLYFYPSNYQYATGQRWYGHTIRPVRAK